MKNETRRAFWLGATVGALFMSIGKPALQFQKAVALSKPPELSQEKDNEELTLLIQEDQSDRKKGGNLDEIFKRDRERQGRVKELYQTGELHTGADYYNAALILQHTPLGLDSGGILLAHELSIVAIAKGYERAKWLAAATEDRYLMYLNRPQRFGTQYRSDSPGEPLRHYKTDPDVTDSLRREFNVPPLEEARKREREINAYYKKLE